MLSLFGLLVVVLLCSSAVAGMLWLWWVWVLLLAYKFVVIDFCGGLVLVGVLILCYVCVVY